jgi:hypothetical protein
MMIVDPVIAAAGFAELSPEESQRFCQVLAFCSAIPFVLFSLCYVGFLIVFFRNPMRRQQASVGAVLALIALWATVGCTLLVPSLFFLPEALGLL